MKVLAFYFTARHPPVLEKVRELIAEINTPICSKIMHLKRYKFIRTIERNLCWVFAWILSDPSIFVPVNCLHPGSQLPGGSTGRGWGDNWRVLAGSTLGHFRLSRSLLCCLRRYELVKRRNEIAHDCLEQRDIKFNIQNNPRYWNGIVLVLFHGRFRSYMKSRSFQRRIVPGGLIVLSMTSVKSDERPFLNVKKWNFVKIAFKFEEWRLKIVKTGPNDV